MKRNPDIKLSKEDLELLNSSLGLKNLLRPEKVNISHALELTRYESRLNWSMFSSGFGSTKRKSL